jgi:hypothetical protein
MLRLGLIGVRILVVKLGGEMILEGGNRHDFVDLCFDQIRKGCSLARDSALPIFLSTQPRNLRIYKPPQVDLQSNHGWTTRFP